MQPPSPHPQEVLAELLAAGCPCDHVAAVLGHWKVFTLEARMHAMRKTGHRGNDEFLLRFRAASGQQLRPEEMAAPVGSPLRDCP